MSGISRKIIRRTLIKIKKKKIGQEFHVKNYVDKLNTNMMCNEMCLNFLIEKDSSNLKTKQINQSHLLYHIYLQNN